MEPKILKWLKKNLVSKNCFILVILIFCSPWQSIPKSRGSWRTFLLVTCLDDCQRHLYEKRVCRKGRGYRNCTQYQSDWKIGYLVNNNALCGRKLFDVSEGYIYRLKSHSYNWRLFSSQILRDYFVFRFQKVRTKFILKGEVWKFYTEMEIDTFHHEILSYFTIIVVCKGLMHMEKRRKGRKKIHSFWETFYWWGC